MNKQNLELENKVEKLEHQIDELETNTLGITKSKTQSDQKISALESAVSTNTNNITTLQTTKQIISSFRNTNHFFFNMSVNVYLE